MFADTYADKVADADRRKGQYRYADGDLSRKGGAMRRVRQVFFASAMRRSGRSIISCHTSPLRMARTTLGPLGVRPASRCSSSASLVVKPGEIGLA